MLKSGNNSEQARTEELPANQVKYLARAYLTNIADISTDKMPTSLLEALDVEKSVGNAPNEGL